MLSVFDPEELYNNSIFLQKLETKTLVNKSVEKLVTNLNKMALNSNLNLSKHPAHKLFNLPEHCLFNNCAAFYCAVANTTNRLQIFYLLSRLIRYNITTYEKITQYYTEEKSIKQTKITK